MMKATKEGITVGSDNTKVLTIYFSHSGNTRKIANEIHKVVGGDIVEIQPEKPYPNNYNTVVEQVRREMHSGYKPKLKTRVADLGAYDTVFVGSPNWWHTVAPPVLTYLAESDLAGKTIIPFITHGGGGLGRSSADIAELCPNATILDSLALFGADIRSAQKWLAANWPI